MIGFLVFVLVVVSVAGGAFYGCAYLKAKAEKTSVSAALLSLLVRK